MAERAARKTKKTSKTKAKSAPKVKAEARPPSIGHNVPDEVIERHVRKITQTGAALETAKGKHRQAYADAKDDGVNTDALKLALKLHLKRDHGVVVTDYADAGRILKIMDSPLATQLDLFQELNAAEPPPYAEGLKAGKNAEDAQNNPHKPGTDPFQRWAEGWAAGQSENANAFLRTQGEATH